jgi:hypothetical protein
MDKLRQYQKAIKLVLEDFWARQTMMLAEKDVETLLTADDQHKIYMVLRNGWQGKERVQNILIFVRLVNGRIWVEEDWTDFDVVGCLLEAGIPQEDIVLAFHHPQLRPLTEFAIA